MARIRLPLGSCSCASYLAKACMDDLLRASTRKEVVGLLAPRQPLHPELLPSRKIGHDKARVRYAYPSQAPPQPKPQRLPLGTRVADPLEGRTGHIARYDSEKDVYHLVYNDGHEEDRPDAEVDRFVIRAPAPVAAAVEEPQRNENDPEALLGLVVLKVVRSYDAEEHPVAGSVASYLPGVKLYRVVYANGLIEDMTLEDTKKAVERANRKRKADTGEEEQDEETKGDDDEQQARKRHKVGMATDTEPPLNAQKFPSRSAAYTIVRKVLRSILAQEDVKKHRTEKQRLILANEDIKPKKALENFVDADGLKFLQAALVLWMKKAETHPGAMLVLKLLGALPGVTPDAVLSSQIGKTLKGIMRVSQQQPHVDLVLGDLADWVIRVWRREVVAKGMSSSARAKQEAQAQGTTLPALYVLPTAAQRKVKEREATTQRLRKLLTEEDKPVEPAEPAIFLANYNSLGSVDKRRPIRQIIHIESLVERARKRHDEYNKPEEGEDEQNAEVVAAPASSERPRVIRFRRRDEVHEFRDKVATYKLLLSERAKIDDATRPRSDSTGDVAVELEDDAAEPIQLPPPNKLTAPAKSILKVKLVEDPKPLSSIRW